MAELDPNMIAARIIADAIVGVATNKQSNTLGEIAWALTVRAERIARALERIAKTLDPVGNHVMPPPPGVPPSPDKH